MAQPCSNCEKYSRDLKKCSGCRSVFYCSTDCQRKHWPRHKMNCKYDQAFQDDSVVSPEQANQCCSNCKRQVGTLKRCTVCHSSAYCSKSCQREHWSEHKTNCKLLSQSTINPTLKKAQQCACSSLTVGESKSCTVCRTTAYGSKSGQLCHWPEQKTSCQLSPENVEQNSQQECHRCANCNTAVEEVKRCARCSAAVYCSKSCQKQHWPKHKDRCKWSSSDVSKSSTQEIQKCGNCTKVGSSLKKCVGCSAITYCSKFCQQAHWPTHKANCKWPSHDVNKDSTHEVQKCGNCNTAGSDLKKCTGCCAVVYCSKVCQQAHWPKHKISCIMPSSKAKNNQSTELQYCANCMCHCSNFNTCNGCRAITYCSQLCQQIHWPKHQGACGFHSKGKKPQKQRKGESSNASPEPVPTSSPDYEGNIEFRIVRDVVTGLVMTDKQEPLPEFFLPLVPPPEPTELSRLVDRLVTSLPQPTFFDLADGQRFTFITDMARVMPENCYLSVLQESVNTILVAKIVRMDECWIRNGIRIMADKSEDSTIVHFHLPGMNSFPFFKWSDAIPGNYICIRAPVLHSFLDGQVGFRINHPSEVRILSASGQLTFGI